MHDVTLDWLTELLSLSIRYHYLAKWVYLSIHLFCGHHYRTKVRTAAFAA